MLHRQPKKLQIQHLNVAFFAPFITLVGHNTNGATIPSKTATGVKRNICSINMGMRLEPINPRKEYRIANVPIAIRPIISQISVRV
jgi:hypothetical protein